MLVYQRVSLHTNHGKATTDIPISKRQCVGCYTARIQFLNFTSFAIGETNSNDENRQSTLETHEPANLQHRKLLCMFCQSAGLNCTLTCCLTFEANIIRSFHLKSSIYRRSAPKTCHACNSNQGLPSCNQRNYPTSFALALLTPGLVFANPRHVGVSV